MYRGKKIRLLPTPEQEIIFWKSAGVARWAYNFFLAENFKSYQDFLSGKSDVRYLSAGKVKKYINNVLKPSSHKWLKDVSCNVMKRAVDNADIAIQRFFKKLSAYPKFKTRHKSKISFYVNYETLKRTQRGFRGERLGEVKTAEPLPKIKTHYSRPYISFDGKYWYLSLTYEVKPKQVELTAETIGIDLGVKNLAILSNGVVYENINRTARIKKIEKRLIRAERKASRKIEKNILKRDKNQRPIWIRPLKDCKNIERQNNKLRRLHKKLTDIRNNYLHQITTAIVKTKPSQIVMEKLNIRGMMKNHHLAKAISEQKFFEFKRQIQYKCENYGISFIEVPTNYPSSKLCSHCGNKKSDLKLKDRIYKCSACGAEIDRDLNAAINLAKYPTLPGNLSLGRITQTQVVSTKADSMKQKDIS